MNAARKVLDEAMALPVDERAFVVDSLLRSLNAPDPAVDREWAAVAQARLAELRAGRARAIPLDDVVSRIRARFGR